MKKIKFIQINVYKGKYLGDLIEFLRQEDPDFVSMQEVTSGELNEWHDKRINIFDVISKELEMPGFFSEDVCLTNFANSCFGNAILTKLPILNHKVFVLKDFRNLTKEEFFNESNWPEFMRCILDLSVEIDGQTVHAMSLHGAWTAPPQDTEETVRQAVATSDYLKSLGNAPFILGCDLNNVPDSRVVKTISAGVNNLMLGSGVFQTTHPRIHKIAPRGYLIDYIFTSCHFVAKSLIVPAVMVSDHLPVIAQLEWRSSN